MMQIDDLFPGLELDAEDRRYIERAMVESTDMPMEELKARFELLVQGMGELYAVGQWAIRVMPDDLIKKQIRRALAKVDAAITQTSSCRKKRKGKRAA